MFIPGDLESINSFIVNKSYRMEAHIRLTRDDSENFLVSIKINVFEFSFHRTQLLYKKSSENLNIIQQKLTQHTTYNFRNYESFTNFVLLKLIDFNMFQ